MANYSNPPCYGNHEASRAGLPYHMTGNNSTGNREVSQQFDPLSFSPEGALSSYGSSPYVSSSPMTSLPQGRPTSTSPLEQQLPSLQIRSTMDDQQCISPPDHHFKRLLPKQGNFAQVSRPTLTAPAQPSPNIRLPHTPEFKHLLIPQDIYEQPCSSQVPYGYETSAARQDMLAPSIINRFSEASFQQTLNSLQTSRWQQAREYRRKVYEPPYIDPNTDDSIAYVEANAEAWVEQLIRAMTNTKDVKDTAASHHRRLFSSDGIDSLLIEACCREIFTALIDRCTNGFRGPAHFNKALKGSHQLEPDRTATCEERIQNVLKVLSWNKRACKDVLYEDWKIRLLVNHPLSYDKEKDSQKGSNDQRRRRQLAEREKMERTEEELRAYRDAYGEGQGDDMSAMRCADFSAYEADMPAGWLQEQSDGRSVSFGSVLGKRVANDGHGVADAKRQRA